VASLASLMAQTAKAVQLSTIGRAQLRYPLMSAVKRADEVKSSQECL